MKRFLVRCALAWLALLAGAGAQAQISQAQAEQLMKLSGGWSQLASMAPQLKSSLEQGMSKAGPEFSDEARSKAMAAAAKAFEPDRLRATARRTLAEGVRANFMPELLAWYQGEPGRRVTRAEEQGSEDEARSDQATRVQTGVALLQGATAERRQILARVVEVTRAGQATTDFVVNLAVAVQASVARLNPKAPPANEAQLRAEFEGQRPQMARAFEGLALANSALVYKDLGDDVVAAYVQFLAGAAGDHYNDLSNRAVEAALTEAFLAVVREAPPVDRR